MIRAGPPRLQAGEDVRDRIGGKIDNPQGPALVLANGDSVWFRNGTMIGKGPPGDQRLLAAYRARGDSPSAAPEPGRATAP